MRIVICDDDILFINQIRFYVEQFLSQNELSAEVADYVSAHSLISTLNIPTDLFLIDVKYTEYLNFEIASKIRTIQPDTCIIFISNMVDEVFASFAYAPLRFLRKDFISEEIDEALSSFLINYQNFPSVIEVTSNNGILIVPVASINIAESDKHYIHLYCGDKYYTIRGKLSDYYKTFSHENIFPINQSYMINLKYIKYYKISSVTLENDLKLNISKKYRETFKINYFKYQQKYFYKNL